MAHTLKIWAALCVIGGAIGGVAVAWDSTHVKYLGQTYASPGSFEHGMLVFFVVFGPALAVAILLLAGSFVIRLLNAIAIDSASIAELLQEDEFSSPTSASAESTFESPGRHASRVAEETEIRCPNCHVPRSGNAPSWQCTGCRMNVYLQRCNQCHLQFGVVHSTQCPFCGSLSSVQI